MLLADAIKDAGLTQQELARRLGVTAPAVNQWARGVHPIPVKRRAQIEAELGIDLSIAEVDYTTILDGARTPLGYTVLWTIDVAHHTSLAFKLRSPEWLEQRVSVTARYLRATKAQLESALLGDGLLLFEDVREVAEMFRVDGNQLEEHVGNLVLEGEAALELVQQLESAEALDFNTVRAATSYAEMAWRLSDLQPGLRVNQSLYNGHGEQLLDWWLEGGYPDIGTEKGQDLEGRYDR